MFRAMGLMAAFGLVACWPVGALGAIIAQTMSDSTYESLYSSGETSLSDFLASYTDPHTGAPAPITRRDGTLLIVGDLSLGQDPAFSDQTQFQRFSVVDEDVELSLTLLGGIAGYSNILGVYSYDAAEDIATAELTMTPLLTGDVDEWGTAASFSVEAGRNFGFYLDANGQVKSKGVFFSENFRNTDGRASDVQTDHFLTYDTNRGLILAVEDLGFDKHSGMLGDQDYQDMIAGILAYADGTPINFFGAEKPIPQPTSLLLVATGGAVLVIYRRFRRRLA